MREVIRDIFTGSNSVFTGKFLASFLMFPIFFASLGATPSIPLNNIVDESAINDTVSEVREPDAGIGNIQPESVVQRPKTTTPVGIADQTPATQHDLTISGKVATSVVNVGIDGSGAVAVPGYGAGYYSTGGAHLLVGHNTGVFAGLYGASVGDVVNFRGENYAVYDVKVYDYDPSVGVYDNNGNINENGRMMYASLYSGGATGLNLMTCYGAYVSEYATYNQRLVVFAKKI